MHRALERQTELAVGRIHERVAPGLDLRHPRVDVEGAGTAARDDVAADERVRNEKPRHAMVGLLDSLGPIGEPDNVSFVTHDAAYLEPDRAGGVGDASGVFRRAAATGKTDVDVDQDLVQARTRGGADRRHGVDGDGDARVEVGQRPESIVIDRLVGEQEIVAEPGLGQTDQLARCRGTEGAMTVRELPARELGALVGLHVRAQASRRQRGGHRGQIALECRCVDDERGRGQVSDEHACDYGTS